MLKILFKTDHFLEKVDQLNFLIFQNFFQEMDLIFLIIDIKYYNNTTICENRVSFPILC